MTLKRDFKGHLPLGGKIRHHFPFWKTFCNDRKILSSVAGHKIPFLDKKHVIQNKKPREYSMSSEQGKFIDAEISELLKNKCIKQLKKPISRGWHSQIFLVPRKPTGYRLILDLSQLNFHIKRFRFKIEGIERLIDMLDPLDWLISVDLKSAYSSIGISRQFVRYLQFSWRNIPYVFTTVPFGISNGPFLFVSLSKAVLRLLRKKLVEIIMYIDDTLVKHHNRETLLSHLDLVLTVFQNCGFTINWKKSSLIPSRKMTFLGFDIDTEEFTITLTRDKRSDIFDLTCKILRRKSKPITIRLLAKIIGKIVATFPCSNHSRLHYRDLDSFKVRCLAKCKQNWNRKIRLNDTCIQELRWWKNNIFSDKMKKSLYKPSITAELVCDASGYGFGSVALGQKSQGLFSEEEKKFSINTKELLAIYYGLATHLSILKNQSILIRTDNTCALYTVKKQGSSDSFRNAVVRKIYDLAFTNNITLDISYVKTTQNVADSLSRKFDFEFNVHREWSLDSSTFDFIKANSNFVFEMDLFGSYLNFKVDRYCAYKFDPFAEHINAFTLNWSKIKGFIFCPFSLISRVIRKIENDKAKTIAGVFPWFPTASWFPIILHQISAPPVLLPKNSAKKLYIPWDKSLRHPLHGKLRLVFLHLSASCFVDKTYQKSMLNSLPKILGVNLQ